VMFPQAETYDEKTPSKKFPQFGKIVTLQYDRC
jgi:hypothetical protein